MIDDEIAGYWGVCFMDLMGYRRELLDTDLYPPPPSGPLSPEQVRGRFHRVIWRRNTLTDAPREYVETLKKALDRKAAARPGRVVRPEHLEALSFRSTGFADSVVVEKALRDRPFAIISLANVVLYGAIAMILNLSDASPVRGGIDVAYGVSQNGVLYSAGSVNAYLLEGKAEYPRLLVGDKYRDYVARFAAASPVEQDWAAMLETFTFKDPDDHHLGIDFLGAAFRAKYLEGLNPDAIRRIWKFANDSYQRFKNSEDKEGAKLRRYYERLIGYVGSRLHVWSLKASDPGPTN